MTETMAMFAGYGVALYAAHHIGDYWIQTDHQVGHKGAEGREGARACSAHVATYLLTQVFCVALVVAVTGMPASLLGLGLAMLVSGGTHYVADRREHGLMFKLARRLPTTKGLMTLGVPRAGMVVSLNAGADPIGVQDGNWKSFQPIDNPSLGTGAWALDQSWHIFWGVFVAALILAAVR